MVSQKAVIQQMETINKRIKKLMFKYKKGLGTRKKLRRLNEPIMFLIRRNLRLEFHEAKRRNELESGKFVFKHSDGTEKNITLDDSQCHTMDDGNTKIKCYIHHEDWSLPLPHTPTAPIKAFEQGINTALSADLKWKAEEKKANAKYIIAFAILVAVIIGGYILFKMVVPSDPAPVVQQVVQQIPQATIPIS